MKSPSKHKCRKPTDDMQWEYRAPASLIEDTNDKSFGNKGFRGNPVIGTPQQIQVLSRL